MGAETEQTMVTESHHDSEVMTVDLHSKDDGSQVLDHSTVEQVIAHDD